MARARGATYLLAMPQSTIIAGRRSCLTPTEEARVVADFKVWAKRLRRKPTAEQALAYFLDLANPVCLWPEFHAIVKGKGLI